MSSLDTAADDERWIVLSRTIGSNDRYDIYIHPNAKRPTRFKAPEYAKGLIYTLRSQYKHAFAVRESDLHKYEVKE